MIFRYTYKITCLCGSFKDHYYFGQHTTNNLNDYYCGSGTKLNKYFKKYGVIEGETYIKEILAFYNTQEELNEAEYELIGDKYESDIMCLNLKTGGNCHGISNETRNKQSISHIGKKRSEETNKKQSEIFKGRISPMKGRNQSEEARQKIAEASKERKFSEESILKIKIGNIGKHSDQKGKPKSEETRQKMKLAQQGHKGTRTGMHNSDKQKVAISKVGQLNKNKHWRINKETGKREWY